MTISEILSEVVAKTGRQDITNIYQELDATLKSITTRYPFLKSYKSISLSASKTEYQISSDFSISFIRAIEEVRNSDNEPITKAKNLTEYLNYLADLSSGEPSVYFTYKKVDNNTFYDMFLIAPSPNTTYSLTLYYSLIHPTISVNNTTILLDDKFRDLVVCGVVWRVFEGKGVIDKAQVYYVDFERKLAEMISAEENEVYVVKPQQ